MKYLATFFFSLSLVIAQPKDSLYLRVVLPESDTVQFAGPQMRLAASTHPAAQAWINGKQVKVYPSGAFVGMAALTVGPNPVKFLVRNASGDSLIKMFVIVRPEELHASPHDTITIDAALMQPAEDLWLTAGDILEVKMKGSPGQEPCFDIPGLESGIPMRELDPGSTNGIAGIYTGRYVIKGRDQCEETSIRFRIRKNFFSSEKGYSKGKVTIMRDSLPRVAEVVGKRPYMNTGLGADRLGGAKLGFLSPGVRVVVTGKVGHQFRVRLAEGMIGWLPQEYVHFLPLETPKPKALTGTISISGTSAEDVITVSLGQKLPFASEQRINPTSLIVHIYGATSNTNWITHQRSAQEVSQVSCTQAGTDDFQLTILLKSDQHWGHDIGYENGSMKIKIRRPPIIADPASPLMALSIAVDPGHGGDNDGALGSTGVKEKDVNLIIAKEVVQLLNSKGVRTTITREKDDPVSQSERTEKILSSNANLLVSIHCNSIGEGTDALQVSGTSAYYRYPGFKPLADLMYTQMLQLGLSEWGVTGNFNFNLNGITQMPNVLVETAFLSNPEDEMKLLDEHFRKQIAAKIVNGLEEFVQRHGQK
jgi:N-acetylmuramoyl-L-alanine amidase